MAGLKYPLHPEDKPIIVIHPDKVQAENIDVTKDPRNLCVRDHEYAYCKDGEVCTAHSANRIKHVCALVRQKIVQAANDERRQTLFGKK